MKMETTVSNLRRHVEQLSEAFDIHVIYERGLGRSGAAALLIDRQSWIGRMSSAFGLTDKVVFAYPIEDITSYVVVMHEIGHHVAPNGMSRVQKPQLGCHPRERFAYYAAKLVAEEAAWDWARYYIEQQFDWTIEMEQVKTIAFATYESARRLGR